MAGKTVWSLVNMCHTWAPYRWVKKVKASHTRYRALGPDLITGYRQSAHKYISHPPGGRLPLLSARPAVTFPAAEHHRPLAGTKLYCLTTEAHRGPRYEQLAQGDRGTMVWTTCPRLLSSFTPSRIWTHDLLITSPTLYPLHKRATLQTSS